MLRIITDSSAEISQEEAKAMGITVIPLTIILSGVAYLEGVDLDKEEFYRRLPEEFPQTAAPSPEWFKDAYAESNGDETIVLTIAAALSGTMRNAELAARDGNFTNVHVYDTCCTTAMLRIMVETAYKNREKSLAEVIAILDDLRPRLRIYACLDTLEFLYKGGRIKRSVAFVGGLLGIKPIITFTETGAVINIDKVHGHRKGIKWLVNRYRQDELDPNYPIYFLQTDNSAPTEELKHQFEMDDAPIYRINCAVGAHNGTNATGFVYVLKNAK